MRAALANRALDGAFAETAGPVGLGVCLSHLRHVDLGEVQPLYDRASGIMLVADSRLDDRAALGDALDIPTADLPTTPDSALILRAYLKWGDECPAHLLGDFVFAVWDGPRRRLLLARDHMGQRDLCYHLSDGLLAFAPIAKALWAVPDVPRTLSDDMIGRHLMQAMDLRPGQAMFDGILNLPGGHSLSVGLDGTASLHAYWTPQADPDHLGHDEAYYVAAYRRVLGEAVACRLRGLNAPPGLQLSGGYDSAAIAGLAGPVLAGTGRKLVCASSVMPGEYQGTIRHARRWVEMCARDMPWIDLRCVTRDGIDALTDLDCRLAERQTPQSSYSFVHDAMHGALAGVGTRLVMDGHGGDYTLNPRGHAALARFLKTGPLKRFAHELRAHLRRSGRSLRTTVMLDLLPHVAPWLVPSLWRKRLRAAPSWQGQPVQPGFAERLIAEGVVDPARLRQAPRDQTAMRARLSETIDQVRSGGGAGAAAAYHGLTLTRPFHDKRVVELALAIPEDLYLKNGRSRYLACRALAEVYPREFQDRWRRNDDEIPDFQRMVSSLAPQLHAEFDRMERSESLSRMIDFPRLRTLLDARGPDDHNSGWERETQAALGGYMMARFVEWFRRENR
ncbi:asparagine synthase-related protein [Sphingomonas sp.]|uniref:asparagine synthase-related protein n=1 Tax=Sphingomonas sp. TaxID=28214 RepID=UPI003D6CE105